MLSPPVRGRGLKPSIYKPAEPEPVVAPRAGAWIETSSTKPMPNTGQSPPVRGRGLKLSHLRDLSNESLSPPVRGRGLKRPIPVKQPIKTSVAPRAGAWIETFERSRQQVCKAGSPPRAGAWIETGAWDAVKNVGRRPPCGGVD